MSQNNLKIIFIFSWIILLFTPQDGFAEKELIKIGVIAPLTGGLAQRGNDIVNLLKIITPKLNSQSDRYNYQFIIEDGKCGAGNAAITAANKFINF